MSTYWVTAELSEPKYDVERKFLTAEMKVVERMIAQKSSAPWANMSMHGLGVFGVKDWRNYRHDLRKYADKLYKYTRGIDEGVLPVRFSVFNNGTSEDKNIQVHLKISHGRVDELRKPPERPARLDGAGKPWKFKLPTLGRFSRHGIKITAHGISARFSELGPQDGAALIKQVVHIHCTADTRITYEISSQNIKHEAGLVEFAD